MATGSFKIVRANTHTHAITIDEKGVNIRVLIQRATLVPANATASHTPDSLLSTSNQAKEPYSEETRDRVWRRKHCRTRKQEHIITIQCSMVYMFPYRWRVQTTWEYPPTFHSSLLWGDLICGQQRKKCHMIDPCLSTSVRFVMQPVQVKP